MFCRLEKLTAVVLMFCLAVSGGGFFVRAANAFTPETARSAIEAGAQGSAISLVTAADGKIIAEQGKTAKGAKAFIEKMGDKAIAFLGDEALTQAQKESKFRSLLHDSFDMSTIGRFALGRYWRVSTPVQRKEYNRLFEDMVVDVYAKRFSDYQGQSFDVRSFRAMNEKDTLVSSFIVPDEGPEVQVDWRVRYKKGSYKVVDVIVEGVSMSLTQRSDFSSVIQRGGGNVQVLITHLQERKS